MFRKYLVVCLLLALMGAAGASEEESSQAVIDLSKLMDMDRLLEQVADRRVIFVGETHDRYEHHLNQLAVVKSQHERHAELAIGLEFFQQPFQPILDDYIAGRLDEAEFLRKSEYFERWSFDYRLYRPIFRYAREHGIPLIALNTPKEITDKVKQGGMASLSDEEKAAIPQEIDRNDEAYKARLETIFNQHPHAQEGDFERFMDIQLLWDEGMAERAAAWLRDHPKGYMVLLAGAGHLLHGSGIPNRLKRRVPVSTAIVINARPGSEVDPGMGDFLIMPQPKDLPPSGKLGVFLDTGDSPPKVTGFSRESGAKKAGIKKGDSILRIDEKAISSYADIRIVLLDKTAGEHVKVEVERETLILGSMSHFIDVELK